MEVWILKCQREAKTLLGLIISYFDLRICRIFFLSGRAKVSVVVKKRLVPLMCKLCFAGTIDTGELTVKNQCN